MNELQELLKNDVSKAVEKFVEIANSTVDTFTLSSLTNIGEEIAKKVDGHSKGRVLGTLGNIYYSLGRYEDAEKAYLDTLNLYLDLSKKDEKYMYYLAGVLFNLGNLYQVRRRYEDAEKAYRDAINVLEHVNAEKELAAVLVSLGILYAKVGHSTNAENVLKKAFEIKRKYVRSKDDLRELGMILNNIAAIYLEEGRNDEARILLERALEVFEKYGFIEEMASVLHNLSSLLDDEEGEKIIRRLEGIERGLSPDLRAKIKYSSAKIAERKGDFSKAANYYLDAACLAFIAYRNYGQGSVNFIHCFDKAKKLGMDEADAIKTAILRFYFGANVELESESRAGSLITRALSGEDIKLEGDTLLDEVIKIIVRDLQRR